MSVIKRFFILGVVTAFTGIALTGCDSLEGLVGNMGSSQKTAEYIQDPQVNDIYAFKCDLFFSDSNSNFPYCIARVSHITAQEITFIPTDKNYRDTKYTLELLHHKNWGNTTVTWSEPQNFSLPLDFFNQEKQNILSVRRLNSDEVRLFITEVSRRPL